MAETDIKQIGTYPLAFGRAGKRVFLTLWQRFVERNGKRIPYFFVGRGDEIEQYPDKRANAVVCVCFIEGEGERKLLCTSEYRIPIGTREMGFPAGLIDDGDWDAAKGDFALAARIAGTREVLEETDGWYDFTPTEVSPNNLWSSPGMTDESIVYVFGFAKKRETQADLGCEPLEDIEVYPMTRTELVAAMDTPEAERPYSFGKTSWPFMWAIKYQGMDWYAPTKPPEEA